MDKLELQKVANEVRKDIVTQSMQQRPAIRADPFLQQTCSPIYILKR